MVDFTITLTDTEKKGMEYAAVNVQDWIDNAATNRARIAVDEIVNLYTTKALDDGVAIPATRELIVDDAFTRGWVKTAAQRDSDAAAALAARDG